MRACGRGILALVFLSSLALGSPDPGASARRAVHLLSYVGADYSAAVRGGQVVNQTEFDEQLALLREVAGSLGSSPETLDAVRKIQAIVEARGDEKELTAAVERACDRLRVVAGGMGPVGAPSLARGKDLFEKHCARCHGADGSAQTALAAQLKPPPADLLDPRVAEWLSPARVAMAIEFGIPGTAMVPIDELGPAERWDVAFYASTLDHADPFSPPAPGFVLADLASLTDHELREELLASGVAAADAEAALAALRRRATYAGEASPLAEARSHLREARRMAAAGAQERAAEALGRARQAARTPAAAALRGRDEAAFAAWERSLSELSAGSPIARLDEVRHAALRLERAAIGGGPRSPWLAAVAGAVMALLVALVALRMGKFRAG